MAFKYPASELPPKRTPSEETEYHLRAQEQYARLRAAYVEKRRREDEAYRRFRTYGHNNNATEPPPAGE
jgi:hypothetical protein